MPAISIICPVYKAEAYLRRCVDSVLAQTLKDWELILVDDGSPDASGKICDEYAAKDSRIRVIHQANGGVARARQVGLEAARGDYVIHVDPDDWVEPEMYEALVARARLGNADLVMCDYFEDTASSSKRIGQKPSCLDADSVFQELFHDLHGSCWNKLVRRELFGRYGIKFPAGYTILEDLSVTASLCLHDIKIEYEPQAFYHYVQDDNPNSLVRRPNRSTVDSVMRFCAAFEPIWAARGMMDEALSYKAQARAFAYDSRLYGRMELRAMYPDDNLAIFRMALRHSLSAPWDLETWLAQYLPRGMAHLYTAVICRIFKP